MNRNVCCFTFLLAALVGLNGCSSSGDTAKDVKKAVATPDKIQGKAQIVLAETSATDAALNGGGPSIYIWQGVRRYRLYFRNGVKMEGGKEYIVEGVNAQRVIDELGDPDQGKNGYPLQSSCEKAIKTAWPGLAFDVTDGQVSALRARVKRYPARPVFLVNRVTPVEKEGDSAEKAGDAKKAAKPPAEIPEIPVAPEKQRTLLVSSPQAVPAPLWDPAASAAKCKVIIDREGNVTELETGIQLCEAVPWADYKYKPTLQGGKPVNVSTQVDVKFEPRKQS